MVIHVDGEHNDPASRTLRAAVLTLSKGSQRQRTARGLDLLHVMRTVEQTRRLTAETVSCVGQEGSRVHVPARRLRM